MRTILPIDPFPVAANVYGSTAEKDAKVHYHLEIVTPPVSDLELAIRPMMKSLMRTDQTRMPNRLVRNGFWDFT